MTAPLLSPLLALAFPAIDPVLLRIGPFSIHWYGLGYVVGILFGWWYAKRLVSNPRLWIGGVPPFRATDLDDFLPWAALGVVLGGRIGFVLFYDLPRYLAAPLDVFAIWQGGMSFHGGMLGTILAMLLFARSRKILPWSLLDVVAAATPPALGLVRCANFVNGELWGRATDMPWGVVFCNERLAAAGAGVCPAGLEPRHPSQIYEAFLEGLVLFLVLRLLTHSLGKLGRPGCVGGAFVAGYGLARILVEFFRQPDAQLGYLLGGWLTMGMVLSTPMVLAGAWAMWRARPVTFSPRPAGPDAA